MKKTRNHTRKKTNMIEIDPWDSKQKQRCKMKKKLTLRKTQKQKCKK